MFTVSLGPLMANTNGKLYVRGTIVAAAEGLEAAVGMAIKAFEADSAEILAQAGKIVECNFRMGIRERNANTGLDTTPVYGATVSRVLTADEARPFALAERRAELQRNLAATPTTYTPTARPAGVTASADALANVAAEAAAL